MLKYCRCISLFYILIVLSVFFTVAKNVCHTVLAMGNTNEQGFIHVYTKNLAVYSKHDIVLYEPVDNLRGWGIKKLIVVADYTYIYDNNNIVNITISIAGEIIIADYIFLTNNTTPSLNRSFSIRSVIIISVNQSNTVIKHVYPSLINSSMEPLLYKSLGYHEEFIVYDPFHPVRVNFIIQLVDYNNTYINGSGSIKITFNPAIDYLPPLNEYPIEQLLLLITLLTTLILFQRDNKHHG